MQVKDINKSIPQTYKATNMSSINQYISPNFKSVLAAWLTAARKADILEI